MACLCGPVSICTAVLQEDVRRPQDVLPLVGGVGDMMEAALPAPVLLGAGEVVGLVVDREPAAADSPVVELDVFGDPRPEAGFHEAPEFGDVRGEGG